MSNTNNASNVSAGKPNRNGAIFRAPLGTTPPTDAVTTLGADFKPMGYVSSDGLTNSNKISSSEIKAWGGDTVMVSQTDKTDTFSFTLLETLKKDVISALFGSSNVTGDLATGMTVKVNSDAQEEAVWVVNLILNGDTAKRIVIPCGIISDIADIVYKDDSAIGYGLTISCLPDSSGNTHYEYIIAASST